MEKSTAVRQVMSVGKALMAASLFLALVWLRASVTLFAAGAVVYGAAQLVRAVLLGEPWEAAQAAQE